MATLHYTVEKEGVADMVRHEKVGTPAGEQLVFKPKDYRIMLMRPEEPPTRRPSGGHARARKRQGSGDRVSGALSCCAAASCTKGGSMRLPAYYPNLVSSLTEGATAVIEQVLKGEIYKAIDKSSKRKRP